MNLLIADDLTGACDSGIAFASIGFRVEVCLDTAGPPPALPSLDPRMLAINTGTRNLPEKEAAERAGHMAASFAAGSSIDLVYKKIDSTMRGNPGAEIRAIMSALDIGTAFVTPAAPVFGRTVRQGQIQVNGVPLHETAFAHDPLAPVLSSDMRVLLGDIGPVTLIDLATVRQGWEAISIQVCAERKKGARFFVFDAQDEADLDAIAKAGLYMRTRPLFAGSAGLAFAIARNLPSIPAQPVRDQGGSVFFVCGSAHAKTHAQIERLAETGVPCFHLPKDFKNAGSRRDLAACVAKALAEGSAVLAAPAERLEKAEDAALASMVVADVAAEVVALLPEALSIELCVTGGETAWQMLTKLAGVMRLEREVAPGAVKSVLLDGTWAGMGVVTKAGGFGGEGLFVEISKRAQQNIQEGFMGKLPVIGISAGDPAGIGAEVTVKALADPEIYSICRPLVIGDAAVLQDAIDFTGLDLRLNPVDSPEKGKYTPGWVDVLDMKLLAPGEHQYKKETAAQGDAAFRYIAKNIELALAGKVDATVTAPINKAAINLAGHHFAGHTEIYAKLTGTTDYAMMLADGNFRVAHVSTHVPLRVACDRVTKERVLKVIELSYDTLRKLGIEKPRIGVAGLNPHCGEGGLFGSEEKEQIEPAIEAARQKGIDAIGPVPPDTVFTKMAGGLFDLVVVMYHDQGHIPIKMKGFSFDENTGQMKAVAGVNVTLGLPVIRVSVDHGTAFEIAGEGRANAESMKDSIKLAGWLAK